jgi:hypothetical protein
MMPRLTPEQREHAALVRRGIAAVDGVYRDLSGEVARLFALLDARPLTWEWRIGVRRLFDRVLGRFFGLTQRAALTSRLFLAIVGATGPAAEGPFLRAIQRVRSIVERRDPMLWQRVTFRAMFGGGESDPFLRVVRMLTGPHVDTERLARSRMFDPQRRWVQTDGYRLSDRVWKIGREHRRAIDERLRLAIRRGEDAIKVARDIEQYLDPRYAPLRYEASGRIILDQRKGVFTLEPRGGHGSSAARRLARTEITRVHGQATIESARTIPGVVGVRWMLSARHPKPDECDDKARRSSEGMERGVYLPNEVPRYPSHPMDLCTLAHAHMSRRETLDLIVAQHGGAA